MRLPFACLTLSLAGLAAADPLLDRITVTGSFPMANTANLDLAAGTLNCPDETILLTGGASVLSDNNGIPPYIALVSTNPLGNGWTGIAREMTDNQSSTLGKNLILSVVCGYTQKSFSPHLRIVTASAAIDRSTTYPELAEATASCPSGYTLVSGGASVEGASGLVPLEAVLMTSKAVGNSWYGIAREVGEIGYSQATLHVKAVCANASVGITEVRATSALPDDPTYPDVGFASASCPAGSLRLGGGAEILSSNGGIPPSMGLMTSEPTGTTGWSAVARETQSVTRAPFTVNLTASARCLAATPAVTGLQVVTRTVTLSNNSGLLDLVSGSVQCPSGKSMLGGGARILASNNGIPPSISLVTSTPFGNGWTAVARETTDTDRTLAINLTVSAVCAILPP